MYLHTKVSSYKTVEIQKGIKKAVNAAIEQDKKRVAPCTILRRAAHKTKALQGTKLFIKLTSNSLSKIRNVHDIVLDTRHSD